MKMVNKKRALELLNKNGILVDMRSPIDFRDGTIAGAVNLPLKNFLNKLTGTKNKKQVFVIFTKEYEESDAKHADNYAHQLAFENIYFTTYNVLK